MDAHQILAARRSGSPGCSLWELVGRAGSSGRGKGAEEGEEEEEEEEGEAAQVLAASKERFPGQSVYHIKWIQWKEENTPIITQNENGPCPLLAILNVLLLAWKVHSVAFYFLQLLGRGEKRGKGAAACQLMASSFLSSFTSQSPFLLT